MGTKIKLDRCGEQACLDAHVSMYATTHDPKWPLVTESVRFRLGNVDIAAGDEVTYQGKQWMVHETKHYPNACRTVADCRRIDLDACSSTLMDVYAYAQDSNCDGLDELMLRSEDVRVAIIQTGTTSDLVNGGRREVREYRVYSPQAASWTHLTRLKGSIDLKVREVVTEADSMPYAMAVESPFPLAEV